MYGFKALFCVSVVFFPVRVCVSSFNLADVVLAWYCIYPLYVAVIVYADLVKLFGMVYDILAIPLFTVALPIVSPFNLNTTVPPFNAVEPLFTVALTVMLLPAELVISLTLVVVF